MEIDLIIVTLDEELLSFILAKSLFIIWILLTIYMSLNPIVNTTTWYMMLVLSFVLGLLIFRIENN